MKIVDLRSDTVTNPTQEMRSAMAEAIVGDDVFGDDVTVNRLEAEAAAAVGKQAAVFVPTGSFGNQLCVLTHTRRGDEIILAQGSHIVQHELGAAALISGVSYKTAHNENDFLYAEDIERLRLDEDDPLAAHTGLVCLENALSNGRVVPLAEMRRSFEAAKKHNLPVHLDGARIFNAAAALGCAAKDIAACADSVMFCLSKGLAAPVGSLVCGSEEFIKKARRNRKLMGGGMRQVGVLAAAGLVALHKMSTRVAEDHATAKRLATEICKLEGFWADPQATEINMVFVKVTRPGFSPEKFYDYLLQNGFKTLPPFGDMLRLVTHYEVTKQDIDRLLQTIAQY